MVARVCYAIVRDAELPIPPTAEQIVSMPALRRHGWTIAEVERLISERPRYTPRYELVDGELLVTPSPSVQHQRIVLALALRLSVYCARQRIGEVRLGPTEVRLSEELYFEPDLNVVPAPNGQLPDGRNPWLSPMLICEVLSPSSSRHDRITKRRAFQRSGISEYWIADGYAEAFEIWRPGDERPLIVDDRLVWHPAGATTTFELNVREFFASIVDGAPISPEDPPRG